jgi:HSP20 family molecular chaperone IbpA
MERMNGFNLLFADLLGIDWVDLEGELVSWLDGKKKSDNYLKYYKDNTNDKIVYTILLPGVEQDKLDIEYKEDSSKRIILTIKEDCKFIKKETYNLDVNGNIDSKGITSVLKNGVLIITIPKVVKENVKVDIKVE